MAKTMSMATAYKQYFYKNGEHLKGAEFVEAYKQFVIDAFNKNFILLDDNRERVLPNAEKTVENMRGFQTLIDNKIYSYVRNLAGKEKEDALKSDVIACTLEDHKKMKCARLNFTDLVENAKDSFTKSQRLELKLVAVFGKFDPKKNIDRREQCADALHDVAREIKAHKPGIFTYLFRHNTYAQRMGEYRDLQAKMQSAITRTFYPIEVAKLFGGKDFKFLHLNQTQRNVDQSENIFNSMMRNAEETLPNADFTSVYYPKEAEAFKAEEKESLYEVSEEFKGTVVDKPEKNVKIEGSVKETEQVSNDNPELK